MRAFGLGFAARSWMCGRGLIGEVLRAKSSRCREVGASRREAGSGLAATCAHLAYKFFIDIRCFEKVSIWSSA